MVNDPCALLAGILIGTPIAAILLQISCTLFNFFVGASNKPPDLADRLPAEGEMEPESKKAAIVSDDDWEDDETVLTWRGVPKPSMEWAICIVLFAFLINGVAAFIALQLLHLAGQAPRASVLSSVLLYPLFAPVCLIILSGVYTVMLPTSIGKGLLIALLFLFLSILVAALLVAGYLAIAFVFGLRGFRLG